METIRKWVQALLALLANGSWAWPVSRNIYQGPLKVICSPGLNCYSCPAATTYCPIGSLQQLLGGIRLALESGQAFIGLYVLGTIGALGAFVGRMICGWVCPFGLIQELLHKIPSPKFGIPRPFRFIKYGVLLLMVVIMPLFAVNEFGMGDPWFCKYLCPAGTLEAGLPMLTLQPGLRQIVGVLFFNKLLILVGFVLWSVLSSRPFCRSTCPLGAFYGLFSKVKLIRLQLDDGLCIKCGACHSVCPMGVRFHLSPNDSECISCMACKNRCPQSAIYLEVGGIPYSQMPSSKKEVPVS